MRPDAGADVAGAASIGGRVLRLAVAVEGCAQPASATGATGAAGGSGWTALEGDVRTLGLRVEEAGGGVVRLGGGALATRGGGGAEGAAPARIAGGGLEGDGGGGALEGDGGGALVCDERPSSADVSNPGGNVTSFAIFLSTSFRAGRGAPESEFDMVVFATACNRVSHDQSLHTAGQAQG